MKIILAALALAACQSTTDPTPAPAPTPAPPTSHGGVTLRVATPERVAGSYAGAKGGIEFDTARSGDDLFMHVATRSGHILIDAETTPTSYLFHYLDNRLTLEVSKAWVAGVRAEGDGGPLAQDTSQMHWIGDMTALDDMLAVPEVAMLPEMSRTLGEMGITGSDYPASLAVHKIARQSADALAINVEPLQQANEEASFCTAYPNQGNQCYGMCGPGCTCWSWVCGDCCYHYGCARHDDWCRQGQWYYCYNITAVIALFGC